MDENFFPKLLVFIGIILIAWVLWVFISQQQSEKIELLKSDWQCTSSKTETRLQPIIIGKSTFLQPITSTVCTNYTRSN
jgi:hypothetical protein